MNTTSQRISVSTTTASANASLLQPGRTTAEYPVYKVPAGATVTLSLDGKPLQGDETVNDKKLRLKKIGSNLQVETDDEILVVLEDYYTDTAAAFLQGEHWPAVIEASSEQAALLPVVGLGWPVVAGGVAAGAALASGGGGGSTAPIADTTAPTAPTGVSVNSNGTAVSGSAEPGSTVKVTLANGATATATAGTDGKFTVALSPAQSNGQTLTATAADAAGNTSAPATTTAPVIDTTAPDAPSLALGTGVSNGATAAEAAATTGVVTVTAEAGSTTVVTFTNGTHTCLLYTSDAADE